VVAVSKSTATTLVLPGGNIEYTVLVENPGSVAASDTHVADSLPAGLVNATWACAASGGAVCPAASGIGGINETITTLPAGSSVTFTINAVTASMPPPTITNTVTVTPPAGGRCAGSCSATVTTPVAPVIQVEAARTTVSAVAGQSVTLTFAVRNSGNVAADGARIDDPIPTGLASFTWTCIGAGGAVCPNASGSGPIAETVGTFPAGGSLTYVVTALVGNSGPPAITNTVTVTPPDGGICSSSCMATTRILVAGAIAAIPSLSTIGLLVLAAGLAAAAMLRLRRIGHPKAG
jgi:uncharacterized repeat protein (TIGR01451 family)